MPSDEDRIYDPNAQLKDARAKGNVVGEKVITAQLNSLLDRYPLRDKSAAPLSGGSVFDGLVRTVSSFEKYDGPADAP